MINAKWFSSVPAKADLAFFPGDSEEGKQYISEMNYCIEFAKANRDLMADRIKDIFYDITHKTFRESYDVKHNYARIEHHYGQNVWVHRKGATSARSGEIGIIPGSQGTASYIVSGLGNKLSFESCSHGAGRRLGRNEAKKTLNLEHEKELMKGILNNISSVDDLDEAPSSYKDIANVMEQQTDLVKPIRELQPLAVIKG